jgi:hypothetical protein
VTRIGLDRVPARVVAIVITAKMFMMTRSTLRTPRSMTQMMADTMSTNTMMTSVALFSCAAVRPRHLLQLLDDLGREVARTR